MEGDEKISGSKNFQPGYGEDGRINDNPAASQPKKEKINSILIFLIGFFAIIFSGASIYVSVTNPFADILKIGAEQDKAMAEQQKAELLAMQTKDTDADGLSDYDELNKYNTSPYLKDSDGDGVDDKTEVNRGTDPNCPEGQNCFGSDAIGSVSSSTGSVPNLQTNPADASVSITPDYIRQIMKGNGVSDADLAKVTDAELMAEFNQYLKDNPDMIATLASQGISVNTDGLSDVAANGKASSALAQPDASGIDLKSLGINNADDLKNLTGAQVRQLMIQSGASEAVLSTVSDDQLKTMFLSQLEGKLNTQ